MGGISEVKYDGPISIRLELREARFTNSGQEIYIRAVAVVKNGIFDGAEMVIWENWLAVGSCLALTNINAKLGWQPNDPQIVDLIPRQDS